MTDPKASVQPLPLVLHVITGLDDGGAQAVLYRLVRSDRNHRHVVVALMTKGKYGPLLSDAGVRCHCLAMPRGRLTVRGLARLVRIVRQEKPDVVQTWLYHGDLVGGVAARLAGAPRIVWGVHNTTLEPGRPKRSTILVARTCAALSRWIPDRIVTPSGRATEVHAALGYAAGTFEIIPNGCDVVLFAPDELARRRLRDEWRVRPEDFLFGMVARFDAQKDHANLLAAFDLVRARHPAVRLLLVGRGMTKENRAWFDEVERRQLRPAVIALGPRDDIPAIMNALDAHVLSSAYGEAFPNVVTEAMACGTPCIATDVGDAAVMIGETGWIVPPRDPPALAAAMEVAIDARRKAPGWEARRTACRGRIVEHYTIDRMVAAYGRVWDEATG